MASQPATAQLSLRTRATASTSITHPQSSSLIADYAPIHALRSNAIDLFNSRLTKDERKKIDLQTCPHATFPDLLKAATAAKDKAEHARYPWTETVQKICGKINRYAVVGDLLVQHHAEYTSLVWGAFRFLLLVTVEEANTSEKLSEALEAIIQVVFRAEEYAKLFSSHSGSSTERVFQSLQENLTRLYAEVLNFLIRATKFFQKSTLRRYASAGFSSFGTKFQSVLERVERYERNVEKDKGLLESEDEKLRQDYENGVWLKHADFTNELKKLQQVHILDTCKWFLTSDTFLDWKKPSSSSSADSFLWVSGKPGSGKSTLAAQIVQDLQSPDIILLSVFCKDGEENKNTLGSILRNLTFQLLEQSPRRREFHQRVQAARLSEKSQFVQSTETLWTILESMLETSTQVRCILDGLDECNSSLTDLVPFLDRLTGAFKAKDHDVKLMVISRLDQLDSRENLVLWNRVQIQSSDVRPDIERIASIRVEDSRVLRIHPEKEDILQALVDSSDGMILWTELMIKELEAGHWNVQRVLENPPRGLSEVYTAILHRFSAKKGSLARIQHALRLILAAVRPLHLKELALGLAVADGLPCHEDYDLRGEPIAEGQEIVLESSPLLVMMPDGTVQIAHTSLKDYLHSQETPSALATFRFQSSDLHNEMASILISYLSFQCFTEDLEQPQSKHHFLEYASRWLVHHATRAEDSRQIAERLISFFSVTQGWKWVVRLSKEYGISLGHLQLMQSEIRLWAQDLEIDHHNQDILSSFLLVLAQNRYREMNSLSKDHPSVIRAMSHLALMYSIQGQWKETEELEIQMIEISLRVLGQEHPDTLSIQGDLALTFWKQGRLKEAEELEIQVIEIQKRILGVEHPHTLISMSNLAPIFGDQGRWKEAEELEMQVLEMKKRVLGVEHPHTLTSMNNLAPIFWKQGRWKEAEELGVQVLEMRKRVLGLEHPRTLTIMGNLALIFGDQGRWKEAAELEMQVLEMRKRVLGLEHPHTLTSMNNLAFTFQKQGQWKEAKELEVQVLEIRERVLGPEHPDTLRGMNNLATTWKEQGWDKDALMLMEDCFQLQRRILGPDHPKTVMSQAWLNDWKSDDP